MRGVDGALNTLVRLRDISSLSAAELLCGEGRRGTMGAKEDARPPTHPTFGMRDPGVSTLMIRIY